MRGLDRFYVECSCGSRFDKRWYWVEAWYERYWRLALFELWFGSSPPPLDCPKRWSFS